MRKSITILCSIAFMISGIMLAISASDKPTSSGYKTMAAATPFPSVYTPSYTMPAQDTGTVDLPEEFVRTLAKEKGLLDTVYITKTDTIHKTVTKVKWRQAPAPDPIVMRDTIREAHYYLATQVGKKEGPTGECIPIYEVHKVDEICPDNINSSVESINE